MNLQPELLISIVSCAREHIPVVLQGQLRLTRSSTSAHVDCVFPAEEELSPSAGAGSGRPVHASRFQGWPTYRPSEAQMNLAAWGHGEGPLVVPVLQAQPERTQPTSVRCGSFCGQSSASWQRA